MKKLTGALLLVGSPLYVADIRYATGFSATDPVVYLQQGRKKYLVVPLLERERAKRMTKGTTVWTAEGLNVRRALKGTLSGWALGVLRQLRIGSVIVPPDFPIAVAKKLTAAGIRLHVANTPLFSQRQVKTTEELAHIAESQYAAVQAMRAAVDQIAHARVDRKGFLRVGKHLLTSERIRSLINKVLFDYQCIGRDTIVACGSQAADPHEAGSGPLRRGESIVIDIFPQHLSHGYWGDLSRTVVKGTPSAALRNMYHAVKAAQTAALSRVKAGVLASRVHGAAVEVIRRHGFSDGLSNGKTQGFIHSTGHGVGLEIHEMPRVGQRPMRLRKGNVITVEPGLYYPNIGGVRIEDLIVVTRSGWDLLAVCKHFFEV